MKTKLTALTTLLFTLALAGTASADRLLDDYCLSFVRPYTTAALCDPKVQIKGSLDLVDQSLTTNNTGTAVIDRPRALEQGEQIKASWQDASAEAVLYVSGGGHSAVFPLEQLGDKAIVSLQAGNDLLAQGSRATLTGSPETGEQYPFAAATPNLAIDKIRQALANLRDESSLNQICRALDEQSRRFYVYFYGLPDQVGCSGAVKVFFLGSDMPSDRVQPSQSRLVKLSQVAPNLAYAHLSLIHHFAPDGDNPQSIKSKALVMLRRDSQGNWRLANPQSLMPLNVYRARSDPPALTPAQAQREWRQLVVQGNFWRNDYFSRQTDWTSSWPGASLDLALKFRDLLQAFKLLPPN